MTSFPLQMNAACGNSSDVTLHPMQRPFVPLTMLVISSAVFKALIRYEGGRQRNNDPSKILPTHLPAKLGIFQ